MEKNGIQIFYKRNFLDTNICLWLWFFRWNLWQIWWGLADAIAIFNQIRKIYDTMSFTSEFSLN